MSSYADENEPLLQQEENVIRTKKLPQFLAASIACFASISMGFSFGYASPAIPKLMEGKEDGGLSLNDTEISWFASLLFVGALLGGPVCGIIVDKLGRKYGVMSSGFPFVVGWLLLAYAPHVYFLYIGRILTGLGCGMASLSAPLYIAEISTKDMRGLLGSGFQLGLVFGVLIAFCFGLILSLNWLSMLGAILASLMVILLIIVPETPRWYFSKDYREAGIQSLQWLRGRRANIQFESQEIENNIQQNTERSNFMELFKNASTVKPLCIGIVIMFFQQFSGVNPILFYANSVFKVATSGNKVQEDVATIIVSVLQAIFTIVGCMLVDRLGRRILLISSGAIMSFSCVTFALYYLLTINDIVDKSSIYMKITSVGSIGIYLSGFSIGWGPIPLLALSELFPQRVRGISCSLAIAINWTCAFLVTRFYQPVNELITPHGTFFGFAAINFLGIIFVVFAVPETKGKSLEEIEHYFSKNQTK